MSVMNAFVPILKRAVSDPKGAGQDVLNLPLPPGVPGMAFALIVILSAVLYGAGITVSPPDVPGGGPVISPIVFAIVSGAISLAMVFAVWKVGAAMDGTGTAAGSLRLTVLLQTMTLIGQIIELVLIAVAPFLATYFTVILVLWVFWANVNLVAALHGFGFGKALGTMILAAVGVALCLVFLMTLLGFSAIGPV